MAALCIQVESEVGVVEASDGNTSWFGTTMITFSYSTDILLWWSLPRATSASRPGKIILGKLCSGERVSGFFSGVYKSLRFGFKLLLDHGC